MSTDPAARRPPLRRAIRATIACITSFASASASACGDAGASGASGGLVTVFDSTSHADSIIATTVGVVPAAAVRGVVEELRIAPTADDTSLFAEVSEFDVGMDGRLFVFDRAANVLFIFDRDGRLQRRVGRQGAGPGEFSSNNGMVVLADGRLAQWDARNARISFFSADGDFLKSWTLSSGFFTSNGLQTDAAGSVLLYRPVTAPREHEILGRMGLVRLKDGGAFGDSIAPPDLPIERITYVAEMNGGRSATSPTHSPRLLWQWHPDGYMVTANGGRYEIEISRPAAAGGPIRIVRTVPTVDVPAEERAWDQERITFQMRQNVPGWTWPGPAIPDHKPPINALHVGRDGTIWVRVATPSERIPEAELEPQREGRSPRALFREPQEYEAFSADGRFVGRVRLPSNTTFMHADGDRIWYLERDEDGLPAVVRAKVASGLR